MNLSRDRFVLSSRNAGVAELADAQDSGSCGRKVVEVQVLSPALEANLSAESQRARRTSASPFSRATFSRTRLRGNDTFNAPIGGINGKLIAIVSRLGRKPLVHVC